MYMGQIRKILYLMLSVCLLASCYNQGPQTPDAWDLTKKQLDSISFFTTHHYTQNYNFVVKAGSLPLSDEPFEMAFDTLYVTEGEHLVVADIKTIPADSIDSVWVKVARDQMTQGWIRESEMLEGVSPDDPISQFIDFFSDTHLLVFLAFLIIVIVAYGLYRLNRRNAYIVHFNDIDSFYPTLLLGLFVASVWAIIIVGVAALDDVIRHLSGGDAILYLGGLAGVCAVNYVVFSVSTLYYIGYLLLIAYIIFAVYRYIHHARSRYVCGHCGAKLRKKGTCPHCGTMNT